MGRFHDRRIPIHNKERCMGNSSQTEEQGCGIFQMALQNKNMLLMEVLRSIKQYLSLVAFIKRKALNMKRHSLL
jgi:hypothetical protein